MSHKIGDRIYIKDGIAITSDLAHKIGTVLSVSTKTPHHYSVEIDEVGTVVLLEAEVEPHQDGLDRILEKL